MEVASVTNSRYGLSLTVPLRLGARTITAREGVLVRVAGATGAAGWGDVAPLPGFSAESLEEARRELDAVAPSLRGRSVPAARAHVSETVRASSVRFGLELALFDLQAKAAGTTLAHVLSEAPRAVVSLNALIGETGEAALDEADRVRAAGYRAVKLKVGRRPVAEEVALVRRVAGRLSGVALRLDANRAWSMDEARTFADGIDGVPVAYLEEPLADASALATYAAETGLPVALDETVQEGADPAAHPYARAVVIKPTLAGGLVRAQRLARRAVEAGIIPVLSAAFESGVGMRGLVALASALGPADVPVGLDTYRRLARDVLRPRLALDGPCVDVETVLAGGRRVDPDGREREA